MKILVWNMVGFLINHGKDHKIGMDKRDSVRVSYPVSTVVGTPGTWPGLVAMAGVTVDGQSTQSVMLVVGP